jgi:hypothetical protein
MRLFPDARTGSDLMTTSPNRIERRVGQRFSYLLPVFIREAASSVQGMGFTQDLSSRGVFFFTDLPLTAGMEIEVTLRMPSEVTLGEGMPVRCRGRVLRVTSPVAGQNAGAGAETKIGVAVRLDGYEYLPSDSLPNFTRVSSIDAPSQEERNLGQASARS